jgi:hypothetical protein
MTRNRQALCKECTKPFSINSERVRTGDLYCSIRCRNVATKVNPLLATKECEACKRSFTGYYSVIQDQRFCSIKCRRPSYIPKAIRCKVCKKTCTVDKLARVQKKTCSRACAGILAQRASVKTPPITVIEPVVRFKKQVHTPTCKKLAIAKNNYKFDSIIEELIRLELENKIDTKEHIEVCRSLQELDHEDCILRGIGQQQRKRKY